jgi:monoamine oxidase
MARTRLFSALKRWSKLTQGALASGIPVTEHAAMERERFNLGRREFLRKTAVGAGVLTLSGSMPLLSACGDSAGGAARIAIIGAGMAGLMCARTLEKAGYRATLYEAHNRVGGRMWTQRDLPGGQLLELGGELIDTEHMVLRTLATELDLTLDDLADYDAEVQAEVFYMGGRVVSEEEILTAWAKVHGQIAADLAAADSDEAELTRLDALSLHDYLAGLPNLEPTLRDILDLAYVCEYGLPTQEQSAMNLIWLIGLDSPDTFEIFGTSDERFHTHQGNDALPTRVAEALESKVETGHRLVRVTTRPDGRHRLTFEVGRTTVEATYDHVVLTLPWTILRDVEFLPALPEAKAFMIANLGYGTNAKLMLGFDSRPWRKTHGKSGSTLTDNGPQTIWETSRGQAGAEGILTVFTGGAEGLIVGGSSAEARALAYLRKLEVIYPGVQAAYRPGSAVRMHWPTFEFMKGSYACFKPGQAIWSGTEGERVGNLHFAGEHTSVDFQGYMEGAAESGIRAAEEIVADLMG